MLKLVVKTAVFTRSDLVADSYIESLSREERAQQFIVSHANAQTHRSIISGHLKTETNTPVSDLVKLLLMHPSFKKSQGLLDFIYADMLELIGLDITTVNRIADSFNNADLMILSVTDSLEKHDAGIQDLRINGYFEIRLHNNCKSLIKKAMVNLIHSPAVRWERQVTQ